jgi:sugar O-acyltransferase (sialic acid O-acetyltransferase NeuD family)
MDMIGDMSSGSGQAVAADAVAVFGGRGAGALAALTLDRLAASGGPGCLGFLNDVEPAGTLIESRPVLGPFAAWRELPPQTRFVAPLHKPKEMSRRAAIIRRLGVPRARWATLIDPQSCLARDFECGVDVLICCGAWVLSGARLGNHVTLRGGCQVSHDCTVGDFVMIGVNAVLCGYCRVGEGACIAPGALVREGTTIGRYSVVGLGAVVVRDVPEHAIVAGNPARVIGDMASSMAAC